jgi:hypothetical protein
LVVFFLEKWNFNDFSLSLAPPISFVVLLISHLFLVPCESLQLFSNVRSNSESNYYTPQSDCDIGYRRTIWNKIVKDFDSWRVFSKLIVYNIEYIFSLRSYAFNTNKRIHIVEV